MIKVEGKGGISATIIADSISSVNGKRITTFELVYHRYIHSEFMTHRMFSRNAASSRAIPVERMLELVRTQPAIPIHWGANQPGMQADKECSAVLDAHSESYGRTREEWWGEAADMACLHAEEYAKAGYHKQIVNRLTEPFQMMKVVCTATEYENFFWLRNHSAAQPEIAELARCMYEARELSEPTVLFPGDWHTPYFDKGYWAGGEETGLHFTAESDGQEAFSLDEALKISSSCCAQVSYRRLDDSLDKAIAIYDKLVGDDRKHASPFEHCATPMAEPKFWCGDCQRQPDWENGVTHADRNGNFWSGNFQSWIQHRQLIEDHVKW